MSRQSLARLQEAHAFNPAPLRGELHELHVPFDEMTGGHGCEQSLGDALRRGQRVAIACDDNADQIHARHITVAITETNEG